MESRRVFFVTQIVWDKTHGACRISEPRDQGLIAQGIHGTNGIFTFLN